MNIKLCGDVLEFLGFDEKNKIVLVDGQYISGKHTLIHTPDEFALYWFDKNVFQQESFINLIKKFYTVDYKLSQIMKTHNSKYCITTALIEEISFILFEKQGGYLFFRPEKGKTSLIQFLELIAHLRAPEGCPWDRKQTLETLRTNLLEETFEVLETIDSNNMSGLKEELGDLLLQIILQSQIASEEQLFTIFDVINGIFNKIVFRHPHVFGNMDVDNVSGVLQNWERWKAEERLLKNKQNENSILASVPKNLPALALAQKYQERAARVGFDWPKIEPVIEKIEEEILEVKNSTNKISQQKELGDLLFALVNLIRWQGYDAESLLRQMNQRFLKRFNYIEREAVRQGRQMTDLTLAEMDAIWEQAKESESRAA